jgi:hypothetical protein
MSREDASEGANPDSDASLGAQEMAKSPLIGSALAKHDTGNLAGQCAPAEGPICGERENGTFNFSPRVS